MSIAKLASTAICVSAGSKLGARFVLCILLPSLSLRFEVRSANDNWRFSNGINTMLFYIWLWYDSVKCTTRSIFNSTLRWMPGIYSMLVVFCMKLCCGAQYVRSMVWLSNVWSVLFASIYVDAHLRWVWLNNSFFVSLSLRLNSKSFLIIIYIYMYMYIYIIAISTDSLTICVNKTI